ncbi:hypothetical protein B0H66DRAFT_615549 [Apodospora peruviana]|uniref:Uncharacterized protein n=1 Tax=Apodospora peruviana TaxID=516989 RepID=A0AAE0IH58_9PEZI|nr:hypothetical protein B0H66DRAFT_615549 [Apodospora peruviana]
MALSARFLLTASLDQTQQRNATAGVFGNLTSNGTTIAYPLTCNITEEFTVKVGLKVIFDVTWADTDKAPLIRFPQRSVSGYQEAEHDRRPPIFPLAPLPPLKPSVDFKENERTTTPFLPAWEASIKPFCDAYAKPTPLPTTEHQQLHSCTADATRKLATVPHSLFIYLVLPAAILCSGLRWVSAYPFFLNFLHIGASMWLKGSSRSFNWLQLLVKFASGIGEPTVQAFVLDAANENNENLWFSYCSHRVPTAHGHAVACWPGLAGWYLSKGNGFQVLATDAIVTMFGVVMMLVLVMFNDITSGSGSLGPGNMQVPIGVICAIGPWLLTYILFGFIAILLQLGFILGFFEMWLFEPGYMFGVAFFAHGVFVIVFGFLGLTPICALWELGWTTQKKKRKFKELTGKGWRQEPVPAGTLLPG